PSVRPRLRAARHLASCPAGRRAEGPRTRIPTQPTATDRNPMAHVIALANHKGGCAKTTTAANLGAALAGRPFNKRVLLIDADPQANLSTAFGCAPELLGMRLEDALEQTSWEDAPE